MGRVYQFQPDKRTQEGRVLPYRFRSLEQAQAVRDELIARGNSVSRLWCVNYEDDRPLLSAYLRDDKTVLGICRRLNRVLKREGLLDDGLFGFTAMWKYNAEQEGVCAALWTEYRPYHLPVYAVTGASEGHYVHVDLLAWKSGGQLKPPRAVLQSERTRWPLDTWFTCKTFLGMRHAQKIVTRTAELLAA